MSTVGRIHPHLEARVVDPGSGHTLPLGDVGELCVRGYSVMLGYWGDEASTAAVLDPVGRGGSGADGTGAGAGAPGGWRLPGGAGAVCCMPLPCRCRCCTTIHPGHLHPGPCCCVLQEGWMHTGDLATLDGEGYCRVVGRLKDVIIRGGENVYPR